MNKENYPPEQTKLKKKKRQERAKRELRKRQDRAARNVRRMRMYSGSSSFFRPGELRIIKKESEELKMLKSELSKGFPPLTGRERFLLKSIRKEVRAKAGFSIFEDSPESKTGSTPRVNRKLFPSPEEKQRKESKNGE